MNAKNVPTSVSESTNTSKNPDVLAFICEEKRQRIISLLDDAKLTIPTEEELQYFITNIYRPNESKGIYRHRKGKELIELFNGYRVLKNGEESLGGVSLLKHADNTEISTIWSKLEKCGVGSKLVKEAVEEADAHFVGLTTTFRKAFLDAGFISLGYVSENMDMPGMPAFIQSYDLSKRKEDPEIFVLDRTTETQ